MQKTLAQEKGIDIENNERQVDFYCPEHLTGKDGSPKYISQLIDEKLDGIREDLHIEKNVTWMYSHLDYGWDYDYSNDEIPYVIIYSINPQSLEMAVQRLEGITDKEIDDRKEIWDNQQEIEREKYREAKLEEYVQK